MGGNITVKSEIGKGSTFTFHVEIEGGNERTVAPAIQGRIIGIENAKKAIHVLVVDDNDENVLLIVKLLVMVGFETNQAINGADAIAKFEEAGADLILMDLNMPVMDGFEAVRRIRSTDKGRQIPIIALTALSFEEDYQKAQSLDLHGYIRKPFRVNELFVTIAKVLGIQYIYEDIPLLPVQTSIYDDASVANDISKLPEDVNLKLLGAIEVADLDTLVEIVSSFQNENPDLARHLLSKANNYEWDYLQRIL
jgi:CheY-like chemotaxis protein